MTELDEKIKKLLDWSWRVEIEPRHYNGKATLTQMLCGRSCYYGSFIDANKLLVSDEDQKTMFESAKATKQFVSLSIELTYKEPKKYSWEKQTYRTKTLCIWADTISKAVQIAYLYLDEHTTNETHDNGQSVYKVVKLPGE
ncbi:hypothetical protein [Pseudomonas phage vB_PaeM_PS119XW]|uniref:Uncharacterized protein n=1 Tax=Pseudomonas phage vB_PaeM_PS119XW TaxID=2601632 RepID=A0A5C1K7X3_9CAUD|nr:hypothetical protein PP933_gp327 [Pseudomonas phage vB_PaeM_PS119XW]QEM42056.1 hypothetical protein [Pseudomonas phage vB_PaeM_PS119XW]